MISAVELCQTVFDPPKAQTEWSLPLLVGVPEVRYFSYARVALAKAFHLAGLGRGDAVLLPAFICRELLAALHSLGATPIYYPVSRTLGLDESPNALPVAKAVVVVNYFGFPQGLSPFRDYCRRTGAVLIEDNAHGLFSCDEDKRFLGTRGDLGLFSLRKTIPLPNGAALVLNNSGLCVPMGPQGPFDEAQTPLAFRAKSAVRRLVRLLGQRTVYRLIVLQRALRWLRPRNRSPDPRTEREFPPPLLPSSLLSEPIRCADPDGEAARRRGLYELLDRTFKREGLEVEPLYQELPANTVPYGYPYRAREAGHQGIQKVLTRMGLFEVSWPDLPDAVKSRAPAHYKNVKVVQFLW